MKTSVPADFFCSTGAWTQDLFLWWVFQDSVLQTICLAWLQTSILLISASWVARIIGTSHLRWLFCCCCCFFLFLRQGLKRETVLRSGWPQTLSLSASSSRVLELKVCTALPNSHLLYIPGHDLVWCSMCTWKDVFNCQ
jgi:hypothetical protein